jgi:hypothetical protein
MSCAVLTALVTHLVTHLVTGLCKACKCHSVTCHAVIARIAVAARLLLPGNATLSRVWQWCR